ncbi:MAG: cysteine desulfurase [Candidatus Thermoplasmatota archaeon]|nr:cysteine desulfurase [Candidatus Thermoplasmatota archaeon]
MKNIYLDHAASMPVDPRVHEYAKPYLLHAGNPSSLYEFGQQAKEAMENARRKIAEFINAESEKNIIFTGSATESNNIAIRGTALRNQNIGKKVLSSSIEHISVLNPMKELQKNGWKFETINVDSQGILKIDDLKELLTKKTVVTSVNYANNEIGTIEPIREISELVHEKGQYFHVDGKAAAGRIPIDVQADGIDLLTLSSNDHYGPHGAGALYVKPGIKIQSIMPGGGQERGIRSGTENIYAIVGMGEAAEIAQKEMDTESHRLQKIRDALISEITKINKSYLTGHPKKRLPHHASFRFSHIEGESILLHMDAQGIQIATGSACSSKTLEPSHVLLAIGLKHEQAHGSMVLTLGKSNDRKQIPRIVEAVDETVSRLRALSPLGN